MRPPAAPHLAALFALAGLAAPGAGRGEEVIRIAVARGLAEVRLSGEGLAAAPLRRDPPRRELAGGRAEVRLEGDALFLDGAPVEGPGVVFSARGALRFGKRALAGEVEVRRAGAGLAVVDVLPLEHYVAQVTAAEMPAYFPREALKAQAVAVRTYALGKKLEATEEGRSFDLGATVLDQVFPGDGGHPRTRAAAAATAGEVLVLDHRPIEAYFHSACGGRTESGAAALGRVRPYLASAECGYCSAAPQARWTVRVGALELGRVAGLGGGATAARVLERTASGRAALLEVAAGPRAIRRSAVELRRRMGYGRLPSLDFEVRQSGGEFVFEGRGSGHGAGMCQWGARGRARAGQDYRQILSAYYPGAELVRMY